jgi:hypothetical protein
MGRGLRILRAFDPCPDRWALGWYLRAMGELGAAYQHNPFPYFRADVRLLQGRLPEVELEGDPARTAIAEFLMGRTNQLPPSPLGCVIPAVQLLLYQGCTMGAAMTIEPEQVYEFIGWEDDRSRCRLIWADAACRADTLVETRRRLETAARWVLHSGSMEHLCLYHLVRSRIAKQAGEIPIGQLAVDEGLHIARQCGLGLYLVELLCAQAELFLVSGEPEAAEQSAGEAACLASSNECQFLFGVAEAGHLLGRALATLDRMSEARTILEEVRSIRLRTGDQRKAQTDALLDSIGR